MATAARVDAVRAFNRFYTRQIGVLGEQLSRQPVLADRGAGALRARPSRARHRDRDCRRARRSTPAISAASCAASSARLCSTRDARRPTTAAQSLLRLTAKGRAAFAPLDARARQEIGGAARAGSASPSSGAWSRPWQTIERLLGPSRRAATPYLLRAAPARATWAGSFTATARSTPGIRLGRAVRGAGRAHRGRFPRPASIPRASAAGSPSGTARSSARSSWSGSRRPSPSCACCWSSRGARPRHRRPAGRRMRRASPAMPATGRSRCGRNSELGGRAPHLPAGRLPLVAQEPHHSFGARSVGETWELELVR